ncbi:MAG: hypothetical protein FWG10_02900 [Eubacteriaceae bacterium]|nr:hypothetical protein [Eubacteriaceae bacterium]
MSTNASNIINDMENGKSVLLTFGEPGRVLKRKMMLTGFFCRILLFFIFNPFVLIHEKFNPNIWYRKKLNALRFVRLIFPYSVNGYELAASPCGHIMVTNHPTLNDPICAILYAFSIFPEREIIVPVNLPWFESICRYRTKLFKIGVNLVPILTPATALRLGANDRVSALQTSLVANYSSEFAKTISGGGLAVVAQQATRQRYVFADKNQSITGENILSTISLVLLNIRRAKLADQTYFVPVGVTPHSLSAKPKLNPFCKYSLNIGVPILASDLALVNNEAKRSADLYILQKIAELVPPDYHYANEQD